ncbi:hypothetical protein [Methylobacterium sp. A54F]
MSAEPRPAGGRDAAIGAAVALFGAYLAGGALWSWLAWPGQRLDAPRLVALAIAAVMMAGGWQLIRMWLDGAWFERRRRGSGGGSGDPGGSTDTGGGCDGDSGGSCED